MPVYKTRCASCNTEEERRLSFEAYDQVKTGGAQLTCSCGGSVGFEFDPSSVSFVLKDGVSGGWVSKAGKENAYRAKRRQVMAQREKDHVKPKTLVPNFQGQEAATWSDARDAAYSSTYARVKGEHGAKDAAKAATAAAKSYDRYVRRG